jgi:hypothetical protein
MINPYGVQREYGLWLEDVERRDGRARGLAHEVGRARRCKDAADAELRLSLSAQPAHEQAPPQRGRAALVRLLGVLRLRPARETYA